MSEVKQTEVGSCGKGCPALASDLCFCPPYSGWERGFPHCVTQSGRGQCGGAGMCLWMFPEPALVSRLSQSQQLCLHLLCFIFSTWQLRYFSCFFSFQLSRLKKKKKSISLTSQMSSSPRDVVSVPRAYRFSK